MTFLSPNRCRLISPALVLIAGSFPLANAEEWSGNGPTLYDVGTHKVHALVMHPATGNVYSGTGSGTVFARTDASLSDDPQALDDSVVTQPGVAVDIEVLANDFDPEGALDADSVELQTDPQSGTATVEADGTVNYMPTMSFIGTDKFTYTVRDRAGNESNAAYVSVRVNQSPTAGDDRASTHEGEPITIDALVNDSDPDGTVDPSAVVIWNSPANGNATVEPDGRIIYVPVSGFIGADSFTYKVGDNDGTLSNEATVFVTVGALPNAAPVADDDRATTQQGTAETIRVLDNDADPDGTLDPATVAVHSKPANGSAAANADGSISYTPDTDFTGEDSFTYTVADTRGESSNVAVVEISVSPADDPTPPPPPASTPERGGGGPVELPMLMILAAVISLSGSLKGRDRAGGCRDK